MHRPGRLMANAPSDNTCGPNPIRLTWKQIFPLWVLLTIGIAVAMAFIVLTEKTVSRYHASVFEKHARAAINSGNFREALGICTGALRTGMKRSDHWGKVFLLRAKAYFGLGDYSSALSELEESAAFWSKAYYYATEKDRTEVADLGTDLGIQFLDAGKVQEALDAFSAAGLGSGKPVEYLYSLEERLDITEKAKLWPEEPYLVVEDFESVDTNTFEQMSDTQGRVLKDNRLDSTVSLLGSSSNLIEVTESKSDGRSRISLPVYIPLPERPFAFRVLVKEERPSEFKVVIGYWFELAHMSATTFDAPVETLDDNWKRFDIRRKFYEERLAYANKMGYVITGGIINKIGLDFSPGQANRYWVDEIHLYLPD